ncbi:MAG: hypothetical protein KDB69_04405, partial [Acidimicrobiia bacterium]|nr:hypothetical protein [Acidimicrobiia bacterium]
MDLDIIAREHARVVRASVADAEHPPTESLTPTRIPTQRRWNPRIVVAAAVVGTMTVVSAVALLGTGIDDGAAGSTLPPTSVPAPSSTAGTTLPIDARPFDVEAFLVADRDTLFGDHADRIGVVALVPAEFISQFEFRVMGIQLGELQGVSVVPTHQVRQAADAFAERRGLEPLPGSWGVFGLEPSYPDTPIDDWVRQLHGAFDAVVVPMSFDTIRLRIPDGWEQVAELPFPVFDDATVVPVESGLVVIQSGSTRLVRPDGSWSQGEAPPDGVPGPCCGDYESFTLGDSVVYTKPTGGESWIVDATTLTWTPIADRPLLRRSLGSAVIDGRLIIVEQAGRSIVAESRVVALDPTTGDWTSLPSLPENVDVGAVATDGDRVFAAGTSQNLNNFIIGDRNPRLYVFDGSGSWETLPQIPIDGQASTIAWAPGAGLLAWNYGLEAALLDDSGTWSDLDDVPIDEGECYPTADTAADGVVGFCFEPVWFDPDDRTWTPFNGLFIGKYGVRLTEVLGLMSTE